MFIILLVRLFYIQIIEHDRYLQLANSMQVMRDIIQPERGQIYIRDGSSVAPLVLNKTVFTVFADPQEMVDKDEVISKVRPIVGDRYEAADNALDDSSARYVVLARQVSRDLAEQIQDLKLKGVGLQANTQRVYPEGSLASHTIGFVNMDGKGQYGVEEYLDQDLRGTPGQLESVTDVRRIPLTIGQHDVRIPAIHGQSIVLTLDRNIQSEVEAALSWGLKNVGATSGSVVVMDPQNGEVIAMASYPNYDPANYNKVSDNSVFANTAVSYSFEPGSVAKVMTMAAAIDSSAVNQSSTFYNAGCVQIEDARICNVDRTVDGRNLSMNEVLQYSLNTGVVWTLEQMGGGSINSRAKNTLYNYFHDRYRLDMTTNVEQGGEAQGLIFPPDHEQGGVVNYANMTFGQGFRTTTISMLSAFCAVINGGTYYQPRLVAGVLDNENIIMPTEPIVVSGGIVNSETSKAVRDMMRQARIGYFGNPNADNGYLVGAKSGTAQVYDPNTGLYSTTRYIGTFLGYGADASSEAKYAIMVRVDDSRAGGFAGSEAAGPIFTRISDWIINYKGISK